MFQSAIIWGENAMKILIAEDDLTSRSILKAVLTKWGYDPVVTVDGDEAWKAMRKPDSPDVAVLDWEMPGQSGLEVCRKVRTLDAQNPPYIIILTAKNNKSDIVEGLEAGANDFVSKPYDKDELLARIRVGQRMVALQSALVKAKDALVHEATHDPLTGVLNRRAILDALNRELARAKRKKLELCVGLCDIDFFKRVNDNYGHQVGDDVLCGFVKAIQSIIRPYDFLGRYGGEEFLIVITESTKTAWEGLFERVRAEIAEHKIITRSDEVDITVSIGVSGSKGDETADEMLAAADEALYKAKDNGRNQVVFADQIVSNDAV